MSVKLFLFKKLKRLHKILCKLFLTCFGNGKYSKYVSKYLTEIAEEMHNLREEFTVILLNAD